jgi:hypothetical protein
MHNVSSFRIMTNIFMLLMITKMLIIMPHRIWGVNE